MIRPLLVVALAACALSAFAQPRVSPLPLPPSPPPNAIVVSAALAEAMDAIEVLQTVAAGQGPDAADARAGLQRIVATASR